MNKPKREKLFADVDEDEREIYYADDMDRFHTEEVLPVLDEMGGYIEEINMDDPLLVKVDAIIQQITEEKV